MVKNILNCFKRDCFNNFDHLFLFENLQDAFSLCQYKNQWFIQEKIMSETGPFTKICDLKTDPSQKSANLKPKLSQKSANLKRKPSQKPAN